MIPIISNQVSKSSFMLFGANISVGPNYNDHLINKAIPQEASTSNSLNSSNNGTITTNDSLNNSDNNGRFQENQERVRKRSSSSEESQSKSSLKQPKKQQNPKPSKEETEKANFKPPNLPIEILEKIRGMNGDEPKLVMQKYIFKSDIDPQQKRLLIPKKEMMKYNYELILKEDEKGVIERGDFIEVIVILKNKEEMVLKLSKWPKPPTIDNDNQDDREKKRKSGNYVLQGDWMKVIKEIDLKESDVGQLWSFRFGHERRLGFVFLQAVDDSKIINQPNDNVDTNLSIWFR